MTQDNAAFRWLVYNIHCLPPSPRWSTEGVIHTLSLSPPAGRKREWFTVDEAIKVLQHHKPDHAEYLKRLHLSCSPTNGNSLLPSQPSNDNFPRYGPLTTGSVLGPLHR